MKPITTFENAVGRAIHLIDLYDLLHNQRKRTIRDSWATEFKKCVGWKKSDKICRVDGQGSVIIIRDGGKWNFEHFEHEWLGEMLRSALASGVSALDRYIHELILEKFGSCISKAHNKIPNLLAKYQLSLIDAEDSIRHALKSRSGDKRNTRPRTILKERFKEKLNRETFQGYDQIHNGLALIGVKDLWRRVGKEVKQKPDDIKIRLDNIVNRRNMIVHEGDIQRSARPQNVKLNNISTKHVREDLDWLVILVKAINTVV